MSMKKINDLMARIPEMQSVKTATSYALSQLEKPQGIKVSITQEGSHESRIRSLNNQIP